MSLGIVDVDARFMWGVIWFACGCKRLIGRAEVHGYWRVLSTPGLDKRCVRHEGI